MSGVVNAKQKSYLWDTCEHDLTRVIKLRDCVLWAGKHADVNRAKPWDLVIDLTGPSRACFDPLTTASPQVQTMFPDLVTDLVRLSIPKSQYDCPTIIIEWPDHGVPWALGRAYWERLYLFLCSFKGEVLIHCMGGHGRTGSAVAILISLIGRVKGLDKFKVFVSDDPITWVRKKICPECVETQAQAKYVEHITGLPCAAAKETFNSTLYEQYYKPSHVVPHKDAYTTTGSGVGAKTERNFNARYKGDPQCPVISLTFTAVEAMRKDEKKAAYLKFLEPVITGGWMFWPPKVWSQEFIDLFVEQVLPESFRIKAHYPVSNLPEDKDPCPGKNGDQCCGHYEACRAALGG